jgi:hypothetical protein
MKTKTEEILLEVRTALGNAVDDRSISNKLTAFGYTAERIAEGQALLDAFQEKTLDAVREQGQETVAVSELKEKFSAANKLYMQDLKLARIAIKNNHGLLEQLEANGRRKKNLAGWIQQAKSFYANLDRSGEGMTAMGRFNFTGDTLQTNQAIILELDKKYQDRIREKGEAQETTQLKNEALDTLLDWFSDFRGVARIAFADEPQALEKLGIVVLNQPRPSSVVEEDDDSPIFDEL